MKRCFLSVLCVGLPFVAGAAVGTSHVNANPMNSGNFELRVDQTFEGVAGSRDYTAFTLQALTSSAIRYNGATLDESLDVYFVGAGQSFTASSITSGSFTELLSIGSYTVTPSFYLAFETPSRDSSGSPFGHTTAYGWVRLSYDGTNFQLLDHAIDYSGQGIIVGTTTVVPEPSGLLLGALGIMAIYRRRR